MITDKRYFLPFVLLTFLLLVACEPLAPEKTPQYVVVTGSSPQPISSPLASPPLGGAVPAGGVVGTIPPVISPAPTVESVTGGMVSTPVPSATPLPPPTAIPSATAFACAQVAGQIIRSSLSSTISGQEVNYQVYLPPCFYESFRRYPYVVLLHGTGYDETMWEELDAPAVMDLGVSKNTLAPFVLVMVDGGELAELNDQPDGASYESIILQEVIPAVERDFCLWGSREGRSIGGISRGGYWAFSIALRHPEMFSAVGGHSPHFENGNSQPETNPLDLAGRVNLDKFPLRIYMDNSASDYVSANVIHMSDILLQNGIEHKYLINPTGDHTMEYWASHVGEYLSFYGETRPYDVSALPSCLEPSP
ncbi:MAG: hypothetical protein HY866_06160 [Chloroflexi bacterium]|nr:hypothetical protein [Chloroflexota bacterium]